MTLFLPICSTVLHINSSSTSEWWDVALRGELGGDSESAAEAVMVHRLECIAAVKARVGHGCTGHHKWCAHVQARQLSRAALCICRLALQHGRCDHHQQ
ncbi:hypothetical protein V6N13_021694 [Hibiscus sabdariffa]|uniref:Secreted protein n=1 Tax=Hibiscus sabdariffa TaxID=183260 RepID=A0ABR2B9Z9_9ROSI